MLPWKRVAAGMLSAAVLLILLPGGNSIRGAEAQTAQGSFAAAPVFSAGGLASVVFMGGTVDQLEGAARAAASSGAWVQDGSGAFQLLVVGGPAFLKDAFKAKFANGFGMTAMTLTRAQTSPTPPPLVPPATPLPTPTPTAERRGTVDPGLMVDVHEAARMSTGTTFLPFVGGDSQNPRIVEVNSLGEILWEYRLPQDLKRHINPGFDAELLPNDNVLFELPGKGVYEIDRSGKIVWSYLTTQVSHDADRLPNGNTIFVFGGFDTKNDAQVVEVNPSGAVVWTWYARDHFDRAPYAGISNEGWTHTNAVQRLPSGNTQISLRNFNFVVEVDPQGAVVRTIGDGILDDPHDPVELPTGNLLAATQNLLPADRGKPQRAVELDGVTGQIVWQFPMPFDTWPVRDANRLPNGNTLITGTTAVVEVTPEGTIVWRLRLTKTLAPGADSAAYGFYKAERIAATP